MIDVTLDLNPVPKGRPRLASGGFTRTPEKTAQFERDLRMMLLVQRAVPDVPLDGPLEVVLVLWRQCRSEAQCGDIDNLQKAVLDACNPTRDGGWTGLWRDDRQIKQITVAIVDSGPKVRGRIVLRIRALTSERRDVAVTSLSAAEVA